jgi:hypothetical protein
MPLPLIEHVVLFKAKPSSAPERLDAMIAAILSLKDKIPGIVHGSGGVNFSARAQGYTHGIVLRFKDRAALDAYLPHPAHQDVVAAHVRPNTEAVLALDYEIR